MAAYDEVSPVELDAKTVTAALSIGACFGFTMSRGLAALPSLICWDEWWCVKVLLSAAAVSLLAQSVMSLMNEDRYFLSRSREAKGVPSVVVGTFVLGIGVAMARSTPEIVFVQLGSGMWSPALFMLLGGICAALVYGLLYNRVFANLDSTGNPPGYLDEKLGISYWAIAFPLAVLMGLGCWALEFYESAWRNEVPKEVQKSIPKGWQAFIPNPLESVWTPYTAGAIMGLLQWPLVYFLGARLDATHTYITPVAMLFSRIGEALSCNVPPYFSRHNNTRFLWQLTLFTGVACGGAVSFFTGGTVPTASGVMPLISGFVMTFGAITAGGGVLGHALSGVSDLKISSFLGICFVALGMFAGAMGPGMLKDAWKSASKKAFLVE